MSTIAAPRLPPTLRLGPIHLAVTDVERSVEFYRRSIGLREQLREDGRAALGAGAEDLLVLIEEPGARPPGRHAGLYHLALLHPSRLELSRAARRLLATGTLISGASDHGISEAIYLPDPDGNGIELAADRGRERWGDLSDPATIGPAPLDMPGLLALSEDEEAHPQADPGVVVGHLHLHVGDVERALTFYRDLVGFEVMTRFPSAAFIAAGGYHHHLGLNTWRGKGVPGAPPDAVGLRRWTVAVDGEGELGALRQRLQDAGVEVAELEGGVAAADPWGITALFVAG
ncbi:MAG: VOC family protein [Actinomycetota bacterium]|nr:VOC family protein [Actinomycetota bacterium]